MTRPNITEDTLRHFVKAEFDALHDRLNVIEQDIEKLRARNLGLFYEVQAIKLGLAWFAAIIISIVVVLAH